MKKYLILFVTILILLTGCNSNNKKVTPETNFQKTYGVGNKLVKNMTFDEFKTFVTSNKTGVIFIGEDDENTKKIAEIFVKNLCSCEVDQAHYIKFSDIDEDELKQILNVKEINYPIIVAFKSGKQTGYFDLNTKTDDQGDYINNVILSAYPATCSKAC
jgi:hypothetical protein